LAGTAGAAGTLGGLAAGAPLGAAGGTLGARGKLLGGLDGVVSDFNATAVAALGGDDPVPAAAGLDGAVEPPAAKDAGFAADHPDPGAVEGVGGAAFGATDVAPGATDVSGLGGTDGAPGARDGVAGLEASGGAGIDVSPVAGPGPRGATGKTGIAVDGAGGGSSLQVRLSAAKLRSVFRPQMGQSHPTSNRSSRGSMLCEGARSRTRSSPTAKPASTCRFSSR
jgi:hypothetical protein